MQVMTAQSCSDLVPRAGNLNVLMVGAERSDEFDEAVRLSARGHRVTVVNLRASAAARRFADEGGAFIRSALERLAPRFGPFDVICENYPFTVGLVEGVCEVAPCPVWLSTGAIQTFAEARLGRLAPGGQWILWTESPGFARALLSLVRGDQDIRRCFSVRIVSLARDAAPHSSYLRLSTRFQVVVQRRPVPLRRISALPAGPGCL